MDKIQDFGWALMELKEGKKVSRQGWNGKGMYLFLEIPIPLNDRPHEEYELERLPYIMMKTADNKLVPWLASQTDILSEDWEILKIKEEV